MALKPNFSVQLSDVDALKRIAQNLGYTQKRGAGTVGSIRQLLEAIIAGDAIVTVKNPAKQVEKK